MKHSLRQGRLTIVLHELREASRADAPTLLLLHQLGGSAADWNRDRIDWDGAVFALDFSGHGESQWLRSSVYYPEHFLGDADTAHAHIESRGARESCVLGRGIGGYVALLLAGARPDRVRAAAGLPGEGLHGAGDEPAECGPMPPRPPRGDPERDAFDPRIELSHQHARPGDYVASFVSRARSLHLAKPAGSLPSWWNAAHQAGAQRCADSEEAALAALAAAAPIATEAPGSR